jgi:thiamine biosynthesis lipoprotein ApbE
MPRANRLPVILLASWLAGASLPEGFAAYEYAFFHENVMGTSLELRLRADTPEQAKQAEDRVLVEIDRLSRIFSGHDPSSEFRRWHDSPPGPARLSPELREVLSEAESWRIRSGGAFDPRVEALSRLWARSAQQDREPSTAELAQIAPLLERPAWRPGPGPDEVMRLSECPLTLNAIAKGFIVERACAAGSRPDLGVRGLLVNAGGDLRVAGDLAPTLGIAAPWADSESSEPIARIKVRDRAVSTSGPSQRGFRIRGRWNSHIFDPRTGRPASGVSSATVIAARSSDADALATIANVLPPAATLRLVGSVPEAECLIVTSECEVLRSRGWALHEAPAPAEVEDAQDKPADADAADASWSRDFELAVNFEINSPEGEGRRYRRPYVAVWIEDKDGQPIRTLTLWVSMGGAGPFQWIPDLKRWYRADQLRKQKDKRELVFTIARPTRPPGQYRAIWDGKDDRGQPVPAGQYTVLIDAAREHGTYQNLRQPVTVGREPFKAELDGGVEIKSATVEYRKKARARPPR